MNPNEANLDDLLSSQGGTPPAAFDFKAFFEALGRFYWIVILTVILGVTGGVIVVKSGTPIFRAQTEIKADRNAITSGVSVTGEYLSRNATLLPEDLKTVERTFLTTALMKRVIAKLDLSHRENFIAPDTPTASEGELTGFLLQNARVSLVPETRLITVSFDHRDPDTAREIANALAEEGIATDRERRASDLQANVDYLKAEAEKLNTQLTRSRKELNDYSRSLGSVSIDQELNIVADKLKDLNLRATHARTERVKIEGDYFEIERCKGDPDKLASLEIIHRSPGISNLAGRISDLRGNLAKLSQRYREGHPFVVQANTELKDLEDSFRERVLEAAKGVEAALAAARHSEESLIQETAEQEKKVLNIKDLAVHFQMLKGQVEVDELSYGATLKRLNEELSQTRSQPVLLQLSALATGAYPVTVAPSKVLLSSLFAGLLLGVGIIGLIVQVDSTIKSPENAERHLSLPVLSAVPEYTKGHAKRTRWQECASLHAPHSGTAEAFRTLRTTLHAIMEGHARKFVLLTGVHSGDGASFCTLNLGVALAQSGLRTLLIDTNLRAPVLEERIFGSRGNYGISDFLQGRAALSSVILASGVPNLDIITAGSPSTHPVELLSRSRLRVLLDGVEPLYDRVIVDAAPVVPVSDTLCFARFFPNLCLIVRSGRTNRAEALRAIDQLTRSGAKISGVVLNFAAEKHTRELLLPESVQPLPLSAPLLADFPQTCSTCQRRYENMEEYISLTTPPEMESPSAKSQDPEFQQSPHYLRRCTCGTLLTLPPIKRRDNSDEGLRRRELFGELLDLLEKSGMPHEEARSKLLLTLKTWRNEISSAIPGEESNAGLRRRQLVDELLGHLKLAGFPEEQARTRLLKVIEAWRDAP